MYTLLKSDQIRKVLSPSICLIPNGKTSCHILTSFHYHYNQTAGRLTVNIVARSGNLQQELRELGIKSSGHWKLQSYLHIAFSRQKKPYITARLWVLSLVKGCFKSEFKHLKYSFQKF